MLVKTHFTHFRPQKVMWDFVKSLGQVYEQKRKVLEIVVSISRLLFEYCSQDKKTVEALSVLTTTILNLP